MEFKTSIIRTSLLSICCLTFTKEKVVISQGRLALQDVKSKVTKCPITLIIIIFTIQKWFHSRSMKPGSPLGCWLGTLTTAGPSSETREKRGCFTTQLRVIMWSNAALWWAMMLRQMDSLELDSKGIWFCVRRACSLSISFLCFWKSYEIDKKDYCSWTSADTRMTYNQLKQLFWNINHKDRTYFATFL